MPKKSKIDPEELAIFHEAMKGIKPLTRKKVRIVPSALPPSVIARTSKSRPKQPSLSLEKDRTPLYFHESLNIEPVSSEDFIEYKQSSIPDKSLRKLRKGQYNVEAILDLHGMTIEEARTATEHFLQDNLEAGLRVVLIIHGKGHQSSIPILKNKLNRWLRSIDVVLAFCSAAPEHGNRGATYVLLKRGG